MMKFCGMPHKEWNMGQMNFGHSGWYGWHLLAILGLFMVGYSMGKDKYDQLD